MAHKRGMTGKQLFDSDIKSSEMSSEEVRRLVEYRNRKEAAEKAHKNRTESDEFGFKGFGGGFGGGIMNRRFKF